MDPFQHFNSSFSNPYHPLLPSPPHQPHFPPLPPPPPAPPAADPPSLERERLPQWSHAETALFLAIRAELDHSFLSTKRNKALWEAASARLLAQGFSRTPDQCKSKWKNLVTRFKGSEAVAQPEQQGGDPAGAASRGAFPFHDEMRRMFDARVERTRALERKKAKGKGAQPEDDDGGGEEDVGDEEEEEAEMEMGEKKAKGKGAQPEDDDGGGEEDVGDEEEEEAEMEMGEEEDRVAEVSGGGKKRGRKTATRRAAAGGGVEGEGEVEAILREFMRRQMEMEERWMEAAEAREAERRAREEEWRTAMIGLGEERLALVRRWREREDAWRARAEEREERRHQLVAALLAKLGGDTS